MSRVAWDTIAKRMVPLGTRRWTVEWYTLRDGHAGNADGCADHHPVLDCADEHEEHFRSEALALTFARRKARGVDVWCGVRIAEEVFEDDDGEGNRTGCATWERVGEYEEVE